MSDQENQDQEPSMEEILASIRKIISEDGEEAPADAAPEVEEAPLDLMEEAEEEPLELEEEALELEEEALELEEEVEEEPLELEEEVEDLEPLELDEELEPEPILELVDPEPEPAPAPPPPPPPAPKPAPAPVPMAALADVVGEKIISDNAFSSGQGSFLQLEDAIRMGQAGETLEDIVKGLLQPMLRGWLDQNLPSLVERLVQHEIQKMAGGARRNKDDT